MFINSKFQEKNMKDMIFSIKTQLYCQEILYELYMIIPIQIIQWRYGPIIPVFIYKLQDLISEWIERSLFDENSEYKETIEKTNRRHKYEK